MAHSPAAHAADTNNGPNTISAIKTNWVNSDGNDNTKGYWVYYYKFDGTIANAAACPNTWDAKSADANINTLLQSAFMSGMAVDFGISNDCTIDTVQIDPQ
ncbi:hypothetical protein BAU07_24270 [Bordetella flabilis]|uniref:Uncharacterized protein n=1 Tax=Bordetella flabilis TaxID=463014 RepID=A0A193GK76_9BORD|nr:hypothetical protein BAU07_24270 [Bordetella flabilis]